MNLNKIDNPIDELERSENSTLKLFEGISRENSKWKFMKTLLRWWWWYYNLSINFNWLFRFIREQILSTISNVSSTNREWEMKWNNNFNSKNKPRMRNVLKKDEKCRTLAIFPFLTSSRRVENEREQYGWKFIMSFHFLSLDSSAIQEQH